jgi:hypothetical protein
MNKLRLILAISVGVGVWSAMTLWMALVADKRATESLQRMPWPPGGGVSP